MLRKWESVPAGVKAATQNSVAAVTYSISPGLPSGLKLNLDGSITGQALDVSPDTVYTITATDGVGGDLGTAVATFNVKVDERIPVAISGVSSFAFEQYETAKSVRLSPADGVTIYGNAVWTATTALPSWLSVAHDGNDLVLSGNPSTVNATGIDVGFTLTDDHGTSAVHNLHLTVSPPASASIELPASIPNSVTFLSTYYADLAANTTLTKVAAADVTWSTVLDQSGDGMVPGVTFGSDGTLQGQPLAIGSYSFGIKASAPGGVSGTRRYTITVYPEAVGRVAASSGSNCLQLATGSLKCWGSNANGLLADGSAASVTQSAVPVNATTLSGKFIDVAGGYSGHMCALRDDRTVWCWGLGSSGQLGNSSNSTSRTPVQVSNLTNVQSIIAGYRHTCATKTDGSMWCWGKNSDGQIGDGTKANATTPKQVLNIDNASSVTAIGYNHTCATKSDGSAWCWGNNGSGQLGDNKLGTSSVVPVRVSGT